MKYVHYYKTLSDVDTTKEFYSPGVLFVSASSNASFANYGEDVVYKIKIEDGKIVPEKKQEGPGNDEIWYTSFDGEIVEPVSGIEPIPIGEGSDVFGANIQSNTYSGGKGVIKFDGNVSMVGYGAFIGSNLVSITLPSSITSLDQIAFMCCYGLSSITLPSSLTSIGVGTFSMCVGLTSVTIPATITSIGQEGFAECESLAEVICNPTTPPALGCYAFADNASGRKIKVPASAVDTYKAASGWSSYAADIISQ